MKSGTTDIMDRLKFESRHSGRRKMSKTATILNGAELVPSYAAETERAVRHVNHDHAPCIKSPVLTSASTKGQNNEPLKSTNLPCETDHIYAVCGEMKNRSQRTPCDRQELEIENKNLSEAVYMQLDIISSLKKEVDLKEKEISALKKDVNKLKARLGRREHRMCLLRKSFRPKSGDSTDSQTDIASEGKSPVRVLSAPVLATRYFGRKSRTVPSRALKRRYLGPPKFPLSMKEALIPPPATETTAELKPESSQSVKVEVRGRGRKRKTDFLTTDKEYFLPGTPVPCPQSTISFSDINVPSWKLKPIPSFYQMEGTENINDEVFARRHEKREIEEKRRKRWDIQRLRELKANEKLLKGKRMGDGSRQNHSRIHSFFPNPKNIEHIEVTEQLPVLAFGTVMPLFQPSEFSLPWKVEEESQRKARGRFSTKVT